MRECTVDGVTHASIAIAARAMKVTAQAIRGAERDNKSMTFTVKGHLVELAAPDIITQPWQIYAEPKPAPWRRRPHRPGSRLLEYGYVTHRLGAYGGQRV